MGVDKRRWLLSLMAGPGIGLLSCGASGADYRYAKFGRFEHTFFSDGDLIPVSVKVETHRASFGLAYKFGPSPIVAR